MRRDRKRTKIVINVTSLIDVIFLLLIFFLVTSTFSEQPALKIDLPRAVSSGGSATNEQMVLAVSRNGNIYLDQREVTRSELPGLLAEAARSSDDSSLVLRADRQVSYGLIVEIMDISRRVGLEKIVAMTESDGNSRGGPGLEELLNKNEEGEGGSSTE